ncbi:hypothetical protein [Chitinophaga qingshengii]|uniref:DNA-deoxyinosine glycosylase n=1 Tax=Chitinophaga qingshengii TaxID=1569794 RepID=A0ABR7TWP6_9BACT|nr:hypothetical protein [Chitinophaga qingshengii]MBC9934090.1 hypothetical protein [Chitinophaga qingshengii]
MAILTHRMKHHRINPETETLIIGTFNPDTDNNLADFFYGRQRNFLWTLIPVALGETSLKGRPKEEKKAFMAKHKIDFIDVISAVDVDEATNYQDDYLDNKVTAWTDVISEIDKLPHLKRICLTRRTFGGIPNIKAKVAAIKAHCDEKMIPFQFLTTPARGYHQAKQTEWTHFFRQHP